MSNSHQKFRKLQLDHAMRRRHTIYYLRDSIVSGSPNKCYSVNYRKEDMTDKEHTCAILSEKIKSIPFDLCLFGKQIKETDGKMELVECTFRQYEFDLDSGILYLYIKDKKAFFEPQDDIVYFYSGRWQRISITYETMLLMRDNELKTVIVDFD